MFDNMQPWRDILERLRKLNIRLMLLIGLVSLLGAGLIYRLFTLQIVNGDRYLNSFQLRIRRDVSVPGARGNIYDRKGRLLAGNELAYSVVIRDVFEDGAGHDPGLNGAICRALDIIEEGGMELAGSFQISLTDAGGYAYTVSGQTLLRFLADVYGETMTDNLTFAQRSTTADDLASLLAERYGIDAEALGPSRTLDLITVRYRLALNSYQKYLPTTIASDVSDRVVATIMENSDTLSGITVEETTVRRYYNSKYFSLVLGYTGQVSPEELEELRKTDPTYDTDDIVGKSGIEASMEQYLRGSDGTMTLYVDSFGRVLEAKELTQPGAGNDVYLSLDSELTMTAYDVLERKLAAILLEKIRPIREYVVTEESSSSDVVIPIYEVYYSVINNNVIDLAHMASEEAGENERAVRENHLTYRDAAIGRLDEELHSLRTPYRELPKEYRIYQSYIVTMLRDQGVLVRDRIDTSDQTYIDWTINETIPLAAYLEYAIAQGWVDVSLLDLKEDYSSSSDVFESLARYIGEKLRADTGFTKRVYHYMILNDVITGDQICSMLMEQKLVTVPTEEKRLFLDGLETSYEFMLNRIRELDLTPAQLNLDPYSGSMVITDPDSGEVLALVSYPGFDNNRMANGVDAVYFEKLRNDLSRPLYNYATQQATAPGSTFKMVSATAGLMEGAISLTDEIVCTGTFSHFDKAVAPHCWIWPQASHGFQNVQKAITNSCNVFFYEVGYRLGTNVQGDYDSELGIDALRRYAEMYGLNEKSGIEIEEALPRISTEDAVRSAIGQGNHNFTTVSLARYLTAVASSGMCYQLTLIDRITDSSGGVIIQSEPRVRNVINMDASYWNAIHAGMRGVVLDKPYFADLPVHVAGKTGTAQETNARPNHALFLCYAPYEAPRIAVATRVANGYTSDYAAQIAHDVLAYYFGKADREDILEHAMELVGTETSGD